MLPPRMGREWLPPFGAGGALHELGGEVRGNDEPDGGLEGLSALSATDTPPAAKRPARPTANDPEWRRLCALAPAPPHNIASALDDRLQSPILFSPTPVVSPPSSSSHWSPRIPRPRLGKPSEIPGRAQSPSDAPPAPLAGFPPPEFPCRSGFTRRLLFSRVRKNQPKEAMSFRFFKDAYQLSISTYSGLKPRSRAFRSIS